MWISRDARSMQLEHWSRRDIDETQTTMRAVFDKLPADGYLVLIPGTFHPNFSDFPLLSPLTHWLGLTGPIDARRANRIIDAFSLAFFDRHLKGRATRSSIARSSAFPKCCSTRVEAGRVTRVPDRMLRIKRWTEMLANGPLRGNGRACASRGRHPHLVSPVSLERCSPPPPFRRVTTLRSVQNPNRRCRERAVTLLGIPGARP